MVNNNSFTYLNISNLPLTFTRGNCHSKVTSFVRVQAADDTNQKH